MPLYNEGVQGGGEDELWGSWCASDFHLTLMMFIYFGENGKYTKCKRDWQVCVWECVLVCVYVCVGVCVYCIIFLLLLPLLLLLLFVSLVFCFALFWQPGDIDSRSSLSWVPHHHLAARILAPALWTLVSFFATTATSLTYMKKRLITHRCLSVSP